MKIETPIGPLWLDADQKGLTAVSFERISENEEANAQILSLAKKQLEEYFSGERHVFDVPLSFQRGTAFQQKVWRVLTRIPYGQSRTYKQVAQAIGQPKAARAIGQANRLNPLPIVIPCHRVIGQNGQLTGYMGKAENGLVIKRQLLVLENILAH
ncbi:methylated-DNA--[protein]-cysteine S-methyltransferase [Enterococcus mundtii]|uniref:Methylated-DNA--protein-cysteine methyltransferase n=1 Tax=Enterococcus mundtii TaxID=53346 RepID=A0A242L293_ENTMU|nr:methylated-DNA--[protein]-cysteine S-methyltransferase [Enterococcus mundtii]MDA9460768.1 Methylated-DNA--protein-cysteine methyltransferase [Enterococcus mundtii 3F]MDB7086780.1 methylated-DNA--[protein]-cysteine S-methyltransferase [Enterococcus mundtii]OTP28315.1 hypothetical protein A5802_002055 [Enterococcus mundtii]